MSDNTPIKNPAASLFFTPKLHPDWWVKLVTLAANAVGGGSTGGQSRSNDADCAGLPRPRDAPRWLPPADLVVDAIIGGMLKTVIITQIVYLLLFHGFHGGGR